MMRPIFPSAAGQPRKNKGEQRFWHRVRARHRGQRPKVKNGQLINGSCKKILP
jgi:hypothetical protein